MPRVVTIRTSYTNDAAYLTRLARAVELDPIRSNDWKREVSEHINAVIVAFLTPVKPSKGRKKR